MATANEQAQQALCAEILAQAHRQAEQILLRVQQEAEALRARAAAEAEQLRQQRLEQARREGARRKELILATIPLETARLRAARIEALLQSLYEEAHRRLQAREGFDYRETLIRLAVEAVKQMADNRLVIKLSPADHRALGEALAQEVTRRLASSLSLSITLAEEPGLTEGGLIVQDAEGHQEWDNRLTVRLNRLWPQLRQQLALDTGLVAQSGSRERSSPARSATPGELGRRSFRTGSMRPYQGPVITRISGPIVTASGMAQAQMYEVVHVGPLGLVGEVVRLVGDRATIQVYEDTTMLQPGAPVQLTGAPLSVWLGPGLVGQIYDGIQRPLPGIQVRSGAWIRRGEKVEPLDTSRRWTFEPLAHPGQAVTGGQVIGEVPETPLVRHRVMLPPDMSGMLRSIAGKGDYTLRETIAIVETPAGMRGITLLQRWPVRVPRPIRERLRIEQPLITGQRVIDTFFPLGKGGAAAIPGGFGTGKTITQHQLAKWSDAHIILFIGCGERGNEMTEVLREFPQLQDPRSGRPLMERTILIANTSNMPVAAREVSIYTGVSLAEYYRDMGLHVAVFADSTSRWAEALRELAARLEEMPAEEGFPATLPTRLAQFYERGGAVTTLGGERGSISIVGAVSPPGGDFSEPVTQHTRRFIRCFWALDTELANARHYPSIHWLHSYSEYVEEICAWWEQQAPGWSELRTEALTLLQREERLQQIVKLVGPDVLPPGQRLILFVAELLKDGFLAQSAFDENDMYCIPERQILLLRIILTFYRLGRELLQAGVLLEQLRTLPCVPEVLRAKSTFANTQLAALTKLEQRVKDQLGALAKAFTQPPR